MKRPSAIQSLGFPAGSIRDVFTRSQLAEVGAVVLAWNHLELYLDQAIGMGLSFPELIQHEITGRIHGVDGKIAIMHLMISSYCLVFSNSIRKRVESTMSAVGECKTYRDAVAHARAVHGKVGPIVETSGARGKMFDLLFTPEALALLARRIEAVSDEVSDLSMLCNYKTAIMSFHEVNRDGSHDKDIRSLEEDFQRHAGQFRRHQKRRLSLPQLPAFPKTRQDRSA